MIVTQKIGKNTMSNGLWIYQLSLFRFSVAEVLNHLNSNQRLLRTHPKSSTTSSNGSNGSTSSPMITGNPSNVFNSAAAISSRFLNESQGNDSTGKRIKFHNSFLSFRSGDEFHFSFSLFTGQSWFSELRCRCFCLFSTVWFELSFGSRFSIISNQSSSLNTD